MRIRKTWRDSEKELFNGELTVKEIAELTGRSLDSVNSYVNRNKWGKQGKLVADTKLKPKIIELLKQGKKNKEIIEITGANKCYVSIVKRELSGKTLNKYTYEEDIFITKNYRNIPVGKIAEKLNRPYGSIVNRIIKLKKEGWIV